MRRQKSQTSDYGQLIAINIAFLAFIASAGIAAFAVNLVFNGWYKRNNTGGFAVGLFISAALILIAFWLFQSLSGCDVQILAYAKSYCGSSNLDGAIGIIQALYTLIALDIYIGISLGIVSLVLVILAKLRHRMEAAIPPNEY